MKKTRTCLIVDPQDGFIVNENYTPELPGGHLNLAVAGASDDMERGRKVIEKSLDYFNRIRVTLDSHHPFHIANPVYFKDKSGNHPQPFTQIRYADLKNGDWRTSVPSLQSDAEYYLQQLETSGRLTHTIWPPHCIIGTQGHLVYKPLRSTLLKWENDYSIIDWNPKGSNYRREHFSGVKAEVEDAKDESTKVNFDLVNSIEEPDETHIFGIAGSHCVPETVKGIIENFKDTDSAKKLFLWTDCISPVPGFEQVQEDNFRLFKSLGVNLIKSTDLL